MTTTVRSWPQCFRFDLGPGPKAQNSPAREVINPLTRNQNQCSRNQGPPSGSTLSSPPTSPPPPAPLGPHEMRGILTGPPQATDPHQKPVLLLRFWDSPCETYMFLNRVLRLPICHRDRRGGHQRGSTLGRHGPLALEARGAMLAPLRRTVHMGEKKTIPTPPPGRGRVSPARGLGTVDLSIMSRALVVPSRT